MVLSLETANFVGLFIETMVFGILLVAVGHCLRILLFESELFDLKRQRDIRWWAVCATVCMLVISIVDLVLSFKSSADALLPTANQPSSAAVAYRIPGWVDAVRLTCYTLQAVLADVILVFRLYVIYGKRWTVKAVLLSLAILIGIAGAVCLILLVVGHNTAWGAAPQVVEIVLLGMDILFNVIATGLIVRKLWGAHVAVSTISFGPKMWLTLIRIIVESGLLYICAQAAVLISEFFGNAVVCFSSAAGPILAIASILILIRTHDMLQRSPNATNVSTVNFNSNPFSIETTKVSTGVRTMSERFSRTVRGSSTGDTVVAVDDLERGLSSPVDASAQPSSNRPPTTRYLHSSSHTYF